jgi:hypothetical protein
MEQETSGVKVPELLAPAGDFEAMRAAVANGASAVYFGLDNSNARHRATNFTAEELPRLMDYLHAHNVKGFLTFNTLIFSDELEEAAEYVRPGGRWRGSEGLGGEDFVETKSDPHPCPLPRRGEGKKGVRDLRLSFRRPGLFVPGLSWLPTRRW